MLTYFYIYDSPVNLLQHIFMASEHKTLLEAECTENVIQWHDKEFVTWFRERVRSN